jgi:hypothetical protein
MCYPLFLGLVDKYQPQGLLQGQAPGNPNSGNAFYGLPPNLTQEQVEMFRAQLLVS